MTPEPVPTHADSEVARRFERAEAASAVASCEARRAIDPDCLAEAASIADGWAVFEGPGSTLNEVRGLGLAGPIGAADIDRIDDFYRGRAGVYRVGVCPLADRSLAALLGERGFRVVAFENVLFARTIDLTPPSADPAIVAGPASREEFDTYNWVVAGSFFAPEPTPPEILAFADAMLRAEGVYPRLARIDGEPAGGAALIVRDGLALLAGAATRPEYRRRGVQRALHADRLGLAVQLGCDLVCQGAEPGSSSQRNAERIGLRVAYTKVFLAPPA